MSVLENWVNFTIWNDFLIWNDFYAGMDISKTGQSALKIVEELRLNESKRLIRLVIFFFVGSLTLFFWFLEILAINQRIIWSISNPIELFFKNLDQNIQSQH